MRVWARFILSGWLLAAVAVAGTGTAEAAHGAKTAETSKARGEQEGTTKRRSTRKSSKRRSRSGRSSTPKARPVEEAPATPRAAAAEEEAPRPEPGLLNTTFTSKLGLGGDAGQGRRFFGDPLKSGRRARHKQ